ncbi:MAG: MBL fold metallo-hydrolase [Lachnospiraceae bacterium]|nr:MBL fold metallo-hydrolase [Lachnospiraceae bacterium]
MIIEFLGADHEVTGSCHYLEAAGKKFLVDCGMQQGADIYENQEIPVNASDLDYIFVTHAHIDHSGLIPLMYNHGFRGQVFATQATTQLCEIMLKDSAHIQESEVEWKNRKARRSGGELIEPLYTVEDATKVLTQFVPCHYHMKIQVCDGISIRFVDAGHLLGSSSIEMWLNEDGHEVKLVFSGDIGNVDQPLIKDPEFIKDADYVLTESTYGDRVHDKPADYAKALADVIRSTLQGGGNLVIPAFSVGRTQEMLYFIRKIKEEHLIPQMDDFEVYMDSPLAVEATNIFSRNISECFDEEAMDLVSHGINPISFPGLRVAVTPEESKMINFNMRPKVIISASGMCEAGRIRHHLKHNLWRPESTILFVGYQVPGTLGFNLLHGAKRVHIFGEEIEVNARILNLPGISGHADQPHLLDWIGHFKENPPKKVFVVHGQDEVTDNYAKLVHDTYGFDAVAPYSGDSWDLISGEKIREGSRIKREQVSVRHAQMSKGKQSGQQIYNRLLAAGQRLMTIIRKSAGLANKDMARFADQINALCDKWDR